MKKLILFIIIISFISCTQKKVPTQSQLELQKETKPEKPIITEIPKQSSEGKQGVIREKEEIYSEEVSEGIKKEPAEVKSFEELLIKDIYFDFNKYDIKDKYKENLHRLADYLISHPLTKLIIEGHCDERGTNEYNLALGERRAISVRNYLISLGVPANRIQTVSYGEERPVCEEHNESCWQQNRRAHFVIIKEE